MWVRLHMDSWCLRGKPEVQFSEALKSVICRSLARSSVVDTAVPCGLTCALQSTTFSSSSGNLTNFLHKLFFCSVQDSNSTHDFVNDWL